MKIVLKSSATIKSVSKKKKFLIFPMIHRGVFYWLTRVKVTKHYNGSSYQITNVEEV